MVSFLDFASAGCWSSLRKSSLPACSCLPAPCSLPPSFLPTPAQLPATAYPLGVVERHWRWTKWMR